MVSTPKIGVILARTGRLKPLGSPVEFVAGLFARRFRGSVEVVIRDSRSTPDGARAAAEELVVRERVWLVLALGGTAVLPAIANTCERLGTPCVSTTLPWQVYFRYRMVPSQYAFHFCWGLDDVASVFADMWERSTTRPVVGCLWNNAAQGAALRDPAQGFVTTARNRGHELVDGGGYAEPAEDFGAQIDNFADRDVDVVTSAAAASDLAAFLRQCAARRLIPRLVTCSRWLTYPFGVDRYGLDRIATVVSWTPGHRYRSSVDGSTPEELAAAYHRATARPWLQPLGLAYALFEVALHALATATDPADGRSVARALRGTRLETIAGTLDWTAGPLPTIATIPLAGGQWRAGRRPELVVVDNTRAPAVDRAGDLVLSR